MLAGTKNGVQALNSNSYNLLRVIFSNTSRNMHLIKTKDTPESDSSLTQNKSCKGNSESKPDVLHILKLASKCVVTP